jgi:hypothetical protein
MNIVDAPSEPDRFKRGDSVAYRAQHAPEDTFFHHEGHILSAGLMTDDDGDSEPYKVYSVQYQGGRGCGGFWSEHSIIANPKPKAPDWPIVLPCGCRPHRTRMSTFGTTLYCDTEQNAYCNFECPHEDEDDPTIEHPLQELPQASGTGSAIAGTIHEAQGGQ